MADTKKELVEVAVIIPFPDFDGERCSSDKRCFDGTTPDETDSKGKVTKKGKPIPTKHKIRLDLPIPRNDEEAKSYYDVPLETLIAMGVRQRAYTLTDTDSYVAGIGTKEIDVAGLTALVEDDLPIKERAKTVSETKKKAQFYDALKSKYQVESDEGIGRKNLFPTHQSG